MIGLLQRVSRANVVVAGETIASIGEGLLVLVGIEKNDTALTGSRLLDRLLTYRVFADAEGRMNLDLRETGGALLLVPQFTLAADTRSGRRPGFSAAASPEEGRRLFDGLVAEARVKLPDTGAGRFGAHMQVNLSNEGPVTFWIRISP